MKDICNKLRVALAKDRVTKCEIETIRAYEEEMHECLSADVWDQVCWVWMIRGGNRDGWEKYQSDVLRQDMS